MFVTIKPIKEDELYVVNGKYVMYHYKTSEWVANKPLTADESRAFQNYIKSLTAAMPQP